MSINMAGRRLLPPGVTRAQSLTAASVLSAEGTPQKAATSPAGNTMAQVPGPIPAANDRAVFLVLPHFVPRHLLLWFSRSLLAACGTCG